MSTRFLEALNSGRVILMDGAMGTELIRRGLDTRSQRTHEWNSSHPEEVREVHQAYVKAGAACILTNTFAIHVDILPDETPSWAQWCQEYWLAMRLARSAGLGSHFVLLDIGAGPKAEVLLLDRKPEAEHDALLVETQGSLEPLSALLQIYSFPRLPCLVSFSFKHENGQLLSLQDKSSPEAIAEFADGHRDRLAALGVNCGLEMSMDDIIEVVRRYRKVTDLPILARPNAGTPIRMGDQWVYPHSPKSMAARLPELIDAGATLIGGCCGTTPAHIAAFREVIDRLGVGWKP